MNNRLYPTATIVSLSLVLFAHSVLAQADTIIEEIVVTGELRESALASTPSSVSVLQPGDRRQTAVQQIEQVLGWAPNVNYASGASRARFFQIRGIGERGQFVEPLNSSVGLLLDGVDMSGIGTAATMFDVAQVEVFRGPQGTLYGANALAGLINVVSNAPTTEFEASIQLDAGDYGARGLGAVVSGPLSEQVRFRLGAQLYQDNCSVCHGTAGEGNRELGAPRLNDAIWLYGSSREQVRDQILTPKMGRMPHWSERLDPVTIKMLSAYVWSLGGGEEFVEVAEDPTVEVDEEP